MIQNEFSVENSVGDSYTVLLGAKISPKWSNDFVTCGEWVRFVFFYGRVEAEYTVAADLLQCEKQGLASIHDTVIPTLLLQYYNDTYVHANTVTVKTVIIKMCTYV